MKKLIAVVAFLLAGTLFCYAQKNYQHGIFWGRMAFADTLNSRFNWELQLQKRTQNAGTTNLFAAPHFFSVSPWLTYSISHSTHVSFSPVGYFNSRVFYNSLAEVRSEGIKEYRSTLRVDNQQSMRAFNYTNRLGLEYRLRDLQYNDNYIPNWRVSYMLKLEKPLFHVFSPQKPVTVFASDEVFVQFGEAVKGAASIFNQNRINIGFGYDLAENIRFSASYLHIQQSRFSGNEFDDANALFLTLTFDHLFSQFKKHPAHG